VSDSQNVESFLELLVFFEGVPIFRNKNVVGSLHRLSKEAAVLIGQAQTFGRPRNLAEERWILALAEIYENAFGQPATVWGTGGLRRGFYYFLELSRPKKFPAHGKLHPRQVDRLLKQRRVPQVSKYRNAPAIEKV
jgi:hypothetical protein